MASGCLGSPTVWLPIAVRKVRTTAPWVVAGGKNRLADDQVVGQFHPDDDVWAVGFVAALHEEWIGEATADPFTGGGVIGSRGCSCARQPSGSPAGVRHLAFRCRER